jgi:hypothetical protein
MTTAAILKAINALPVEERMMIIEQVAHTIRLENSDNPSPSGDPWFDDPRNIAIVKEGIKSAKQAKCVTVEESPTLSAIFSKYSQ